MNKVYLMDCMEGMKGTPDNWYDLAVVDPPYGIGVNMNMGRRKGMGTKHTNKNWDNTAPLVEYFTELFRVSQNQIIWGGNYFDLPPSRCFIIWDKKTPEDLSFAMCEFAWTSFDKVAKIFRKPIQTDNNNRIHPTQKPIPLYDWIFQNYATKGMKILDTHAGSMSSVISAMKNEMQITAYEIDSDYFNAGKKRIETYLQQGNMFQQPKIEFIS